MHKKRLLITGANGLLGREVTNLLSKTNDVHVIVRGVDADFENNVVVHLIDLDTQWDANALPRGIDTVIHLAQSSEFRNFPEKALNIFNVNVASVAKLLDYCQKTKVRNFVHASSGGVYGSGDEIFNEKSQLSIESNTGYYIGSKICSELLAQNYESFFSIICLRFFFIYGKNQNRSMLIPRIVNNIKSGVPIDLQGKNGIKINPIHVLDAAQAVKSSIELKRSGKFNVGGEEVLSIREIAERIGEKLNIPPQFNRVEGHPKNLVGDITQMKSYLHSPGINFNDGINELL